MVPKISEDDFPLEIAMFVFDVCFLSRLTSLISEESTGNP